MSETSGTTPYDPDQDPDTQSDMLNPRTGEQASGVGDPDLGPEATEDTDADPANLNPRPGPAEPPDAGDDL